MGDPEAAFPGSLVLARCYGTTHAVGIWARPVCGVACGLARRRSVSTALHVPIQLLLSLYRKSAGWRRQQGAVLPWLRVPVRDCGGLGPDVKGHKHSGICVQIGECCPKASGA